MEGGERRKGIQNKVTEKGEEKTMYRSISAMRSDPLILVFRVVIFEEEKISREITIEWVGTPILGFDHLQRT